MRQSDNFFRSRNPNILYNEFKRIVNSKGGILIGDKWTKSKDLYEIDCGCSEHPNFFNTADKIMNSNQWCPYCCGRKGDFEKEIKEIIHSKNGELLSEYTNSYGHVKVKCNIHNYVWDIMPLNIKKGRWCPVCNLVESEKITYDYLNNSGLKFDIQYGFDDLYVVDISEKLRFDFVVFINRKIILIEIDGDNHRTCYTSERLQKTKEYDNLKNEYCVNNHIKLIRIPYYNYKNPPYEEFYNVVKETITNEILNNYNIAI